MRCARLSTLPKDSRVWVAAPPSGGLEAEPPPFPYSLSARRQAGRAGHDNTHQGIVRVRTGLRIARHFAECPIAVFRLGGLRGDQPLVVGQAPHVPLGITHRRAIFRPHGRHMVHQGFIGVDEADGAGPSNQNDRIGAPCQSESADGDQGRPPRRTNARHSENPPIEPSGTPRLPPSQYGARVLTSSEGAPMEQGDQQTKNRRRREDCLSPRDTLCLALEFLKGR